MDNLTQKSLADLLHKKHESLLGKYSTELKSIDRISLLEEKLDQLEYWVKENRSEENIDKYIKEKNNTDEELENLKKSVEHVSISNRKREGLKEKLRAHTDAMNYWKKVYADNGTFN